MSLLAAWCAGMQMKSSDEITHDLTSLIADKDGQGHCIYLSSAPPYTQKAFRNTKARSHSTACASTL
jgi:hypothetical protein